MARAHCIAVVLLHRNDIGAHVPECYCFTAHGMVVVAIDATNGDAPIIYSYLAVFYSNPSKAGYQRCVLALRSEQLHDDAITLRILSRPRTSIGNREFRSNTVTGEHVFLVVLVGHVAHHGLTYTLTRQLFAPHLHRYTRRRLVEKRHFGLDDSRAGVRICVIVGGARNRSNVYWCACLDEYGAMQSRHPPLVLIFHVTVGAIAHHDDGQLILPCSNRIADVVLAGESTIGAVAHEGAVDKHHVHAVGSPHVQHHLLPEPCTRQGERASVDARGIALWKIRWGSIERHVDVRVMRYVTNALHGPITGNYHVAPSLSECRRAAPQFCFADLQWRLYQTQSPCAVQGLSASRTTLTHCLHRVARNERWTHR